MYSIDFVRATNFNDGLSPSLCEQYIYLVQKEAQCFDLEFWGLKIIDFNNCFNSVVLPSNKDLNCIVSS